MDRFFLFRLLPAIGLSSFLIPSPVAMGQILVAEPVTADVDPGEPTQAPAPAPKAAAVTEVSAPLPVSPEEESREIKCGPCCHRTATSRILPRW